ncbi:DUF3226 domain-containing protein, partial [uncultured Thiohalocapsa sp.]|uniref:DUF3226 domain-containing protein n=1 Tax=uncultured Thiohalocapsa sp. TaxID=768990 RepID=UPI0025CEB8CB
MAGETVLMVEGSSDEHVVKAICGKRQLGKIDVIKPYGGKPGLLEGIPVRLMESDIAALGILLDADESLDASWQAIAARLEGAGYSPVPASPEVHGTVILPPDQSLLPRVGVWLMPDNRLPGILEDFLRFLVPQGDPLLAHAEQAINTIPEGQRRFPDLRRPKALIHTWLLRGIREQVVPHRRRQPMVRVYPLLAQMVGGEARHQDLVAGHADDAA